jgi:hypothetical protein
MERQFVCNLLIRQIQSYEIEAQDPYFPRLMMTRKNGVSQVMKAFVIITTLVALTSGFCVIKAALDDMFGLTKGQAILSGQRNSRTV